jgi:hypothetical protein
MKRVFLLVLVLVLFSATGVLLTYINIISLNDVPKDFFFGVSFGQDTVEEAKLLIEKVKDYTNFIVINSWDISTNETALNKICDYATDAGMNFMVYIYISSSHYPWQLSWVETAPEKWGSKFLGIYLYDEPGGKQIDDGQWDFLPAYPEVIRPHFENVSDYDDAATRFVASISSTRNMQLLKNLSIPVFTSDYALYWFDYLAGYDTILVQLGWNHNSAKHIGLCRGAANAQGKDWGAIITWTYYEPPYLASGPEILQEMIATYVAGAKYVVVFNYARDAETEEAFCILQEEHFAAMEEFWDYVQNHPERYGQMRGRVAFVLPRDYGWGLRRLEDNVWGLWPADEKALVIWERLHWLLDRYGLELDVVYEDAAFDYENKYAKIYFWNTISN